MWSFMTKVNFLAKFKFWNLKKTQNVFYNLKKFAGTVLLLFCSVECIELLSSIIPKYRLIVDILIKMVYSKGRFNEKVFSKKKC